MLLWTTLALAGPAPRNVMVLFNQTIPESAAVADHYAEARPGAHLCPVSPSVSAGDIAFADFDAQIRGPLDACIGGDSEITTLVTQPKVEPELHMHRSFRIYNLNRSPK